MCGKPVDKSLAGTVLPGAPEVDELIPVSRGGSPYDWANVRLAHRACNRLRSNHTVNWARTQLHICPPALDMKQNVTSQW
ncbi:HNH endonuclease [Alloscardovia sp. HMSC034E08]|uniref:HNH endonuclease n=1 Tax=Alloscardovia sp. HMSC034E08 TaxID=1739413 RepID=UPI0021107296|nr:HNH endonuclease [Alloscardovia sp. HMSC034E08]